MTLCLYDLRFELKSLSLLHVISLGAERSVFGMLDRLETYSGTEADEFRVNYSRSSFRCGCLALLPANRLPPPFAAIVRVP